MNLTVQSGFLILKPVVPASSSGLIIKQALHRWRKQLGESL